MADALAIIGVIGVAGQILQLTVKLGLDWKDAPEDAKSFLKEVQALKSILSETHSNVIVDDDFKAAFEGRRSALLAEFGDPTQSTNTSSLINTCKSQLEDILSDLRKRTQGHRLGWERLKGAFTAKKTRETIEDLQRRCLSLNSLISLDALSLGVQTHKEIKRARRDQDDWRREQRSKQILNWLSEADYDAQQSDFLRRRQPGTGQWLLDSQRYQKWVTTPKTTLFCPGIPGAGKTMLTSIVVDDLQNRFDNDSSVSMAYLYCEFRRQTEQTVENLLSSILRQLAQDQPSLPECVRSLHAVSKNRMRPSLRQLSNSLQTLVKSLRRVFIIVDALDECQLSDGCRTRFLNEIFNLQSGSQINIFATSRLVMGITDRFSGAISIRIRAQNSDIRQYLAGSISQLPACVAKSPQLQEEIIKSIIEAVDGMFLLAKLHLDSLKGKRSLKAIRAALETLHTGSRAYDKAYDSAMERITGQLDDQKDLAREVLMWITFSVRPLTTVELQVALAVEIGEANLDFDNVPDLEDIVSVCAGLVTVDKESNIVRLVHYTTQEYFSRTSHRWFPGAHRKITETTVTYLSFDMFSSLLGSKEHELPPALSPDLILYYAFEFWVHHASMPESAPCDQLVSELLLLRSSFTYLEPEDAVKLIKVPIYSGFYKLLTMTLQGELSSASLDGRTHHVRYLLRRGAWPNKPDRNGLLPLSNAVLEGRMHTVKFLLEWDGININAQNKDGHTSLYLALRKPASQEIIDLFLKAGGVDVATDATSKGELLYAAISGGLEDMVRVLLNNDGANTILFKDRRGLTALHLASELGHEVIVQILLDFDTVNVNMESSTGQTPLHLAASKGHDPVARILLATPGIEVDATDYFGSTPFYHAAANLHIGMMRLLLGTGKVDVDCRDKSGATPLWLAVHSGHNDVVEFLTRVKGVNLSQTYDRGRTLLHCAARQGHTEVVKTLVATGKMNVNQKGDCGRTPLYLAVYCGMQEVVEFLISVEGVSTRTYCQGRSLLHCAARYGYKAMVEILLATGKFDVNQANKRGETPLWLAAFHGHQATVEFLLGVEDVVMGLGLKGVGGLTAQAAAAKKGHGMIAQLLKEASAQCELMRVKPESQDTLTA